MNQLKCKPCCRLPFPSPAAAATARLPPHTQQRFRPLAAPGGSGAIQGVACPAETSLLHSLLRTSTDEGLRQAAFHACYRQPHANLAVLDSLVEARHEVARLMGFESFGSYQLDSFSLASHPDAVATFLQRFAADIAPKCAEEAAQMTLLKRITSSGGGGGSSGTAAVQPWDRQFLMAAGRSNEEADALSMTEYLELERVVEGLSELLRRSMGVQLQERGLEPGEGWAPGVRKLAAVHDTGAGATGQPAGPCSIRSAAEKDASASHACMHLSVIAEAP